MRTVKNFSRLLFVTVIVLLTACQKLLDLIPNKAVKDCRIKKIRYFNPYTSFEVDAYEGVFYYNRWGDPDSVIFEFLGESAYNLRFYYDNKKRLRELRETFQDTSAQIRHKYGYTKGLITTDTVNVWNGYAHQVNYFKYDKYERMIQFTLNFITNPPSTPVIADYVYDGNGNLEHPYLDLNYDNKINPHQLHPIWQFIAHDYSVNNPIAAELYNNFRLPVKFNRFVTFPDIPLFTFPFPGVRYLDRSEIEYECKDDNH